MVAHQMCAGRVAWVVAPLVVLALLVAKASAARNGLDLVPPMGWSNWENSGCDVNETYVKANAVAMKEKGLLALGYTIVEVDDCWAQLDRNSSGYLVADATKFPNGMASLGDFLHSMGMKFGMYSSAGVHCCQHTMPGSLGYEWLDAQFFAASGVDFLKYDGCNMEEFASVEQDAPRRFPFTAPPLLRYPIMGQALNKTGRPISYMCNFPWQFWGLDKDYAMGGVWVAEVCNSWRVAGDPQPGFSNAMGYANSIAKYSDQVPSGPGGWATLDAIEIGNNMSFDVLEGEEAARAGQWQAVRVGGGGMTADQEKAAISVYMVSKTPIFIGTDVTKLSGHSLEAYSNPDLIAIHQDPLGAPGQRIAVNDTYNTAIWGCALSGNRSAAVLVNTGGSPADITVTWVELDSVTPAWATSALQTGGDGTSCTSGATDIREVEDVWQHKKIGTFSDKYTAKAVAPSAAVVIIVGPTSGSKTS